MEYPCGVGMVLLSFMSFWLLLFLKLNDSWAELNFWAVFAPLIIPPTFVFAHVIIALRWYFHMRVASTIAISAEHVLRSPMRRDTGSYLLLRLGYETGETGYFFI